MKKFISVLVGLMMLFNISVFATDSKLETQSKYSDMILTALEKSELGENADTKHIYIIEENSYIEISKGNTPVRYYVAIPVLDSDSVHYAHFKNGEYVSAVTDLSPFKNIESPFDDSYEKYLENNGISDVKEVTVMAVFERLHVLSFFVRTEKEDYIIPYDFFEDSVFNVTDAEECRLIKGTAYSVDDFISICEKEAVLYAEYLKEKRSEENKTVITQNADGDEVVLSGKINLEDIKNDILSNIEIMGKGSAVNFNIKTDKENYSVKYSYDEGSRRKELSLFVEEFFEELYVQAGQTSDKFSGENFCAIKLRHKENGKWVQNQTYIDLSEDKIRLRTENYEDVILKLKNPNSIFDYLEYESLNNFNTFNKIYSDENTPVKAGNIDGFTKTDVIDFTFVLPETTDNDLVKEMATPGKSISGKVEIYKENKCKYVYVLNLFGDKGKISFYNEQQMSLSGEEEKMSYNLPLAFLNQCRYEDGNLLMYPVKDSNSYSLKLEFNNGKIERVSFENITCNNLKHTNLTENTVVEELFTEREKPAESLKKLGIMQGDPDGNMRLNDKITRAEAVALLVRVHKRLDRKVSAEFKGFSDMKGHWADEEITYAKNAGITDGTGESAFSPQNNITVQEFVKMLVSLLGYGQEAEEKGGYPFGYVMVGMELGLLKDISVPVADAAVREDIATMIDYGLDVKPAQNEETDAETFREILEK